jgi:hypothetical protein
MALIGVGLVAIDGRALALRHRPRPRTVRMPRRLP